VINWLAWGAYCVAIGGDALGVEITGGEYFIRRHPNSPLFPVSRSFWLFSLCYSFITFGLSIPVLALLHVFHRPSWDRGTFDFIVILASLAWLLVLAPRFVRGFLAWAAA
jgi:hypothetical protein